MGDQILTDSGIAGELLIRVGERSKGLNGERRVDSFAGFHLLVSPLYSGEVELVLRGTGTHSCRLQATAHGTTWALEHVVNHLEDTRGALADRLAQARKQLGDFPVQVDAPFEPGG